MSNTMPRPTDPRWTQILETPILFSSLPKKVRSKRTSSASITRSCQRPAITLASRRAETR